MKPTTRRSCLHLLAASVAARHVPVWAAAAQELGLTADEQEGLSAIAREVMDTHAIPGLSLAFAVQDRLVFRAAFGQADREAGEACTPVHRFRIASVSKPITSVAIHRLIEQGKLAYEDRVFGAGGRLPQYSTADAVQQEICIRHLLTHTCGGWGNKANDPMFQHGTMGHDELIAWTLREAPLEAKPGEMYAYSNFGYCLLGRIIEAVTGEPYDAHVRKHVLEPCGIGGMSLGETARADRQDKEVIYYGQKGEDPYRAGMNIRRMDSHGGWLATAEDIVRFLTHVDGFSGEPDLLSQASLRSMTTPSAVKDSYACGWAVNARPNWWHGGSLPGTSTLAVRTASGMCWAVLANTRLRDRENPQKDTSGALDRMMWRMARSVPRWQA